MKLIISVLALLFPTKFPTFYNAISSINFHRFSANLLIFIYLYWMPACAGMTGYAFFIYLPGLYLNDC